MTIKRAIFRLCVRALELLLMCMPKSKQDDYELLVKGHATEGELDIVTIAFDNPFVIEQQMMFLKKNTVGDYIHIVVDNSSDKRYRVQIKRICQENSAIYISLPVNKLNVIGPSYSHAGALNWTFRKVIRRRQPSYFGFIDHDLFPIKSVDIRKTLDNQPIYGLLKEYGNGDARCWYLWAGLCFYKYDFVKNKRLDFMPVTPYDTYLDTGGGNWYPLYSRMKLESLSLATMEYVDYPEMLGFLDDKMALIDCGKWLHTTNGSNWKQKEEDRNAVIKLLMRRFF